MRAPRWTPVQLVAFDLQHPDPHQREPAPAGGPAAFGLVWPALNSFSLFTRLQLPQL